MQNRSIGDVNVSAIGMGCMPLSLPPSRRPSREQALLTLRSALDAGVTLFDTADAYCAGPSEFGHNELLVAEAVRGRGDVLVATKAGHTRPSDEEWGLNGSRTYLRRACEGSLQRLDVEQIGLFQFHRPDPEVPWEESVGALEELRQEGKIRLVGISNADVAQIRTAAAITQLAAVQNEFSTSFKSSFPELSLCAELGVAFLPWSPLGGIGQAGQAVQQILELSAIAARHEVSVQQVVLSWMLAQSPTVIPIPGASRPSSIVSSAAAADVELAAEDLALIDRLVGVQ